MVVATLMHSKDDLAETVQLLVIEQTLAVGRDDPNGGSRNTTDRLEAILECMRHRRRERSGCHCGLLPRKACIRLDCSYTHLALDCQLSRETDLITERTRPTSQALFAVHAREFLWETGAGFTGLALTGLLSLTASSLSRPAADGVTKFVNPLAPKKPPLPAKAKSVIFLFMYGGPSHIDTFDYKPDMIGWTARRSR